MKLNISTLLFIVCFFIVFIYFFNVSQVQDKKLAFRPIPLLRKRNDLPELLQREEFTVGVELGVNKGVFAEHMLSKWSKNEKYYLIDIWKKQDNYIDLANVDDSMQNEFFNETKKRLAQWSSKTVFLRKYTTEASYDIPDNSVDFVYVDARHDYCGCKQDIEIYWPKLRSGGLMTGHDYLLANEVPGQDWSICSDGVNHPGAVRGAVDEFAFKMNLQVVATYRENCGDSSSWLIRKP